MSTLGGKPQRSFHESELPDVWRERADELEPFAEPAAVAFRACADQLELTLRTAANHSLSVDEASRISGYSKEHLTRLVRTGKIPDLRPRGSKGRIRILACDLPIKPGQEHVLHADVHELASRLTGGKEGHHGP